MDYPFLLSALKLPVLSQDYAVDLDGNGKVDNRLGALFSNLVGSGLDQLRIVRALGTGAADPLAVPVTLKGRLKAGQFISDAPATGSDLSTWVLELPFGPGLPARLAMQWPRIQFGINPSGTRVVGGVLNGSLSVKTTQDDFIPGLANALNLYIATDPESGNSRTIKNLFDTGGCTNPDGSRAVRGDGRIDICELGESALMKALLAPDLQLRSAAGKYDPRPNGAQKDSLSMGVGFTAAAADTL